MGTESVEVIRGTIQRVHYPKGEMSVIADCKVWHFHVGGDCCLRFNDKDASVRCFHPLDPVIVYYSGLNSGRRAKAVYSWDAGHGNAECRSGMEFRVQGDALGNEMCETGMMAAKREVQADPPLDSLEDEPGPLAVFLIVAATFVIGWGSLFAWVAWSHR